VSHFNADKRVYYQKTLVFTGRRKIDVRIHEGERHGKKRDEPLNEREEKTVTLKRR